MMELKFHEAIKGSHDSIQYHFFCKNIFFAARVFRTDSIDHCSGWLFKEETGAIVKNVDNSEKVQQVSKDSLNIKSKMLELSVYGNKGTLRVWMNTTDIVVVNFYVRHSFGWLDPGGILGGATRESVIHQPDLQCELQYQGKTYKGVGYCKKYTWLKNPRYCYWDFYHCASVNETMFLWTADAYFAGKYNYFKLLELQGNLYTSDEKDTYHQTDKAYGVVAGKRYELHFKQSAEFELCILTDKMDGLLRQRFGRMLLKCDGKDIASGSAFHEIFVGTIG